MKDAPLLDLLDDICRNNHGGEENSEAANAATDSRKARDRARMYAWVQMRGEVGATCDEVCNALDLLTQTGYPRFSEMKRDGDLVNTGRRRDTRRGRCKASVFVTRKTWADIEWRMRHPGRFPDG